MNMLYCANPLNARQVDDDWQKKYLVAERLGYNRYLFNYDDFKAGLPLRQAGLKLTKAATLQPIIYRGWMLPITTYQALYQALLSHNYQLINSPEEYRHCYYLPDSYPIIADHTPLTVSYPCTTMPTNEQLQNLLAVFAGGPIIVKDFVKSQKHYWHEACFIPDSNDIKQVEKVVNKFLQLQGNHL
jgi:hypothetical protein